MLQKYPMIKEVLFLALSPMIFSFSSLVAQNTPDYIKYYNEGCVAQKNNDYEAAIEFFKEALDIKPDFPDAWNNLGFCYRMTAKTYLARSGEAYVKALQEDPVHEGALEYQGEYFLMIGELSKSYENYKTLKKMKSGDAAALKEALDPILKQAKDILKTYSP